MALDLWYPNDVARILAALASAGSGNGPDYLRALHDVALAFGVRPPGGQGEHLQIVDVHPVRFRD